MSESGHGLEAEQRRFRDLCHAFQLLEDADEVEQFLTDLMTSAEIKEMSSRWKAARLLNEARPYTEIIEQTGLSSATVARVSSWIKRGAGGYRLLLKRLAKGHKVR